MSLTALFHHNIPLNRSGTHPHTQNKYVIKDKATEMQWKESVLFYINIYMQVLEMLSSSRGYRHLICLFLDTKIQTLKI